MEKESRKDELIRKTNELIKWSSTENERLLQEDLKKTGRHLGLDGGSREYKEAREQIKKEFFKRRDELIAEYQDIAPGK